MTRFNHVLLLVKNIGLSVLMCMNPAGNFGKTELNSNGPEGPRLICQVSDATLEGYRDHEVSNNVCSY